MTTRVSSDELAYEAKRNQEATGNLEYFHGKLTYGF
jgi:hypothetical protein